MEAKHDAASRVLEKIRGASKRNENLHRVAPEVVKKCHEMYLTFTCPIYINLYLLNLFSLRLDEFVHTTRQLHAFEIAREMPYASRYACVKVSGPPHNRIFTMTCKQGDHVTRGKFM